MRRLSMRRQILVSLILVVSSSALYARIVSYSPVTNRQSYPAVQSRTNRHYVLIETEEGTALSPPSYYRSDQVVLYDALAGAEPRTVFPGGATRAAITAAAVWEGREEVPRLLVRTNADFGGENPSHHLRYFYSPDAGRTWRGLALPASEIDTPPPATDVGGPMTRGRGSQIRIGSASFPFCVSVAVTSGTDGGIYAVAADGSTKRLTTFAARLIGSNLEGTQFLINGASSAPDLVETLDLTGNRSPVGKEFTPTALEGWITPEGGIYLFTEGIAGTLVFYRDGIR